MSGIATKDVASPVAHHLPESATLHARDATDRGQVLEIEEVEGEGEERGGNERIMLPGISMVELASEGSHPSIGMWRQRLVGISLWVADGQNS